MKIKLENLIVIDNNVDIDEYIKFRKYVKKNMINPKWLGDFTKADLNNLIKIGAKI